MVNEPYTCNYLNKEVLSLTDRIAHDARAAGLSVTSSPNGVVVLGGLVIRSMKALRVILDANGRDDPDEAYRERHGGRIKARALANSPW